MPEPEMTEVSSSNVHSIGHDGGALYVRFRNGSLYRYPTAGREHVTQMLRAESVGRYLHEYIKGSHVGEKVG